jgi:hypothetical protein
MSSRKRVSGSTLVGSIKAVHRWAWIAPDSSCKVGEVLGAPVEDMLGYRRSPDGVKFREHINKQTTPSSAAEVPVRLACSESSSFPTHTGIFALDEHGKLTLIHAYMPYGKVVEEAFLFEWPDETGRASATTSDWLTNG